MQVIIVGHHSRSEWIAKLQNVLPGSAWIIDYAGGGAAAGHRKALQIAALVPDERCIIMEDDAIPVQGFLERAEQWCARCPHDLISFYLGTSRPTRWQQVVDGLLAQADADYITLPQLIHGVCYSPPPASIPGILSRMGMRPEADFDIGRAWGQSVLYPIASLVEHRDGTPVEQHADGQPRLEPRVARKLAAPLMFDR
jgi:hypothetical protein